MMYGGWGWGGWVVGGVMILAVWALVFWAIVSVARRPAETMTRSRTAAEMLADRLARGEIDADEYQQRSRALQPH